MSDFLFRIITSEFVWGIAIGSALTIVGAFMAVRIQKRRFTEVVVRFCEDAIANVCEFIQNMDDHRNRAKAIHPDFLALIEAELVVYGRNREHLIHIQDKNLRREVRDFFARVSVQLTIVRHNLALFTDALQRFQMLPPGTPPEEAARYEQGASAPLSEAHRACDAMVALAAKQSDLCKRLTALM
jgi:hypothetical protein